MLKRVKEELSAKQTTYLKTCLNTKQTSFKQKQQPLLQNQQAQNKEMQNIRSLMRNQQSGTQLTIDKVQRGIRTFNTLDSSKKRTH